MIRARLALARDQRGFTLSELLVTVALIGLISAATALLYITGNQMFTSGANRAEAQQAARVGMMIQDDLRLAGYGFRTDQSAFTISTATRVEFWADLIDASTHLAADAATAATAFTVDLGHGAGIRVNDVLHLMNGATVDQLTVTGVNGDVISFAPALSALYPRGAFVGVPKRVRYDYDAPNRTVTRDAGDGTGTIVVAAGVRAFALTYWTDVDAVTTVAANVRRIRLDMSVESTLDGSGDVQIRTDVRPRNLS